MSTHVLELIVVGLALPNARYNSLAQEASASLAAQRQRLEEDMEANCAVCSQGEVHVGQQIVFCEYCNVAVHQKVSSCLLQACIQ
jgi:hypothetical protein